MSEGKVKRSITIDEGVNLKIEEIAKQEGRKFSNMVNKILLDYIRESESNQQK